jgi:uncharacterized protein (DUF433 family)
MSELSTSHALTTNEAVALFSFDERRVRKEVEHGVIHTASPPRFSEAAVVYLCALDKLGFEIATVADRKRLFGLIQNRVEHRAGKVVSVRPIAVGPIMIGPHLKLDLNETLREVRARIDRFMAWKKQRIVTHDHVLGGEPVFASSRLSVRHVGSMLSRGAPPAEIREDYPYLSDEDLEFALKFSRAYPQVGRPRDPQAATR